MQMDELINKACRACCERRVNGENPRETLRACKPNQGAADCIQREEATGALRNTKTRIWPRLHEAPVSTLKWRATGGICSMCSSTAEVSAVLQIPPFIISSFYNQGEAAECLFLMKSHKPTEKLHLFFSTKNPTVERWELPLIYGNPKPNLPCINFKSLWKQRLHILSIVRTLKYFFF